MAMSWKPKRQYLVESLLRWVRGIAGAIWQNAWRFLQNFTARVVLHGEQLVATKTGKTLVLHGRRLLTFLEHIQGQISARYEIFVATATPSQKRAVAIGSVATVHLFFVFLFIIGLHLRTYARSDEIEMTLGGPVGTSNTLPKFMSPKLPTVLPPLVESEDTFQANIAGPQGSPNVTSPAEAIASEHQFPRLPVEIADHSAKIVRMTLSITEDGAIAEADVIQSSGIADLDSLAIAWVKAHWRYRPAMKNGVAIAVTTTAILVFSAA